MFLGNEKKMSPLALLGSFFVWFYLSPANNIFLSQQIKISHPVSASQQYFSCGSKSATNHCEQPFVKMSTTCFEVISTMKHSIQHFFLYAGEKKNNFMVSVTFANMARYLVAWLFTYASSC
jgi:hypothetical protein